MTERKFTEKQEKFIEIYTGNGTRAAQDAGYEGDDATLAVTASRLLKDAKIVQAIRTRRDHMISPLVATRARRQEFWTKIMEAEHAFLADRLRASELLGKSEADFTEKLEIDDKSALAEKIARAKKRAAG